MPNWTEADGSKLTLIFADGADLVVTVDDFIQAFEYLKKKYKDAEAPVAVVLDISKLKQNQAESN